MEFKFAKIAVFAPITHADKIRKVLAENSAGHIGNYDYCSFSTKGIGRFRGLKGTQPFIGKPGAIEQVEEEKIETICSIDKVKSIVEAVKKVHPYEEPAIDVFPLLK